MHADYVEEWFAVDVEAGAGASGHDWRVSRCPENATEIGFSETLQRWLGDGNQRRALFCDATGLQIGFAAHDCGDASGVVAAAVGIVGQAASHQQRAEVRIAQSQRTVIMRVFHDDFRGVAGVVHQNFLGSNKDVHGVAVGLYVESPVGGELQQIQTRQVAG